MSTFLIKKSIPSNEVVTSMQTLYLYQRAQRIVYSKWFSDLKDDFLESIGERKKRRKGGGSYFD